MKQIILLICAALTAVTMLSCSDTEDLEFNRIPDSENPSETISVVVEFNSPEHRTKSREYGHSEFKNSEDRISWFDYYVYDSQGTLADYGKCTAGTGAILNMHISRNAEYYMYAIANGPGISPVPRTENEILDSVYHNESQGGLNSELEDSPRLIMTACAALEPNNDAYKVRLDFRRMTARISLSFDTSALNSDVSLEIREVSIVNIPSQVYYFKENAPDDADVCKSNAYSLVPSDLKEKMIFYCYENVQGELLQGNDSQMEKFFPETSIYNDLCTYIILKGYYVSPRKRGEILYRLYPGKDASDFSIVRNCEYEVNVKFSAEGGVDEISWRVVTDGLENLTTGLEVRMDNTNIGDGQKLPFRAVVKPDDVSSRHLHWSLSQPGIAGFYDISGNTMLSLSQINEIEDNRGPFLIYGLYDGSAVLSARSTDGTDISASAEFNVSLTPYACDIEFARTNVPMWYLNEDEFEARSVAFSKLDAPAGQVPDVQVLSGEDVIEIVSVDRNGVIVKSKGIGNAVIGAQMGSSIAECSFTVSELGLFLDSDNLELNAGFVTDLGYSITPEHAASMGIELAYCDSPSSTFLNESGKVSVQLSESKLNIRADYLNCNNALENQGIIKVSINGHSVCSECSYTIHKPMKVLQNEQLCLMNYYNGIQNTAKLIDCPSDAALTISWFKDNSTSGTQGSASSPVTAPSDLEFMWNRDECKFSYPSPGTSLNGHYRVHFSFDGDFSNVRYIKADGSPGNESDFIEDCASANVDLKFVEMVYIISYMKSLERNSESKDRYIYNNELIVKCVKHYRSNVETSLFSNLSFDYDYDGRQFHYSGEQDSHTGYSIDYDITFNKDNEYPYIEYNSYDGIYFNSSFIYTGSNAPAKYFEGTKLSVPSINNIGNHNGFWYKYVQKNSGVIGFCKDIDWEILYRNLF